MSELGAVLWGEFGVPTIGYGPGCEADCHAPDEHVAVDRVIEAAYGTAAIAHSLVGFPVFGWTSDDI